MTCLSFGADIQVSSSLKVSSISVILKIVTSSLCQHYEKRYGGRIKFSFAYLLMLCYQPEWRRFTVEIQKLCCTNLHSSISRVSRGVGRCYFVMLPICIHMYTVVVCRYRWKQWAFERVQAKFWDSVENVKYVRVLDCVCCCVG